MNKELNELLEGLNEDEQYDFFNEGVRKKYPLIEEAEGLMV